MTEQINSVRDAVSAVIDPELRKTLGELQMIGDVKVENGQADIEVKLTIAACPAALRIEREVNEAALSVSGVEKATVHVNVMTEQERADLLSRLRPRGATPNAFGPDTLTRVVAITSGKGGVGKSTLTANLAVALTAKGFKVGILDADVYGFSIPALMGLEQDGVAVKPTRLNDMILPPVGYDVKVISIGMFVENNNTAVAWRGPMLQRTISQFLRDVYFGDLDFLLLDLPPGTGDVAITVGQQLPHAEVIIVTTGQKTASDVAVRAGNLAQQTGQRIIGVVENMGPLTLPDGTSMSLFGEGGAKEVAKRLSELQEVPVPVLGMIPLSVSLRQAADQGDSIVLSDPKDPAAVAIIELAQHIVTAGSSRAGKNLGIKPN